MIRKSLVLFLSLLPAVVMAAEFKGVTPLDWSRRLADSEMTRRGSSIFFKGGGPRANWDYTTTLFGLSLLKLAEKTGNPAYADYGAQTAESFITPDGKIQTYKKEEYNIDLIAPGKVLLVRYEQGNRDPRILKGIEALNDQLQHHPRTSEGGFWHKEIYPHQMWLDGLFMASPYIAHYGKLFGKPEAFDEVAKQILLMDKVSYDAKTGLHYHGWDEKRAQAWADKTTGLSPNFWGRAVGWYGMAIVDTLEFMPPEHPQVPAIKEVLRRVADGIVRWQDAETGLWWQVLDQGKREGNYLESTASSMFVYTLAKAINRGYLPRERYLPVVLKGYEGIIRDLIKTDDKGLTSLTQCCSVSGLGYKNRAGRDRDGTFEYYISEPIIDNDLKGVGPFILAGIEVERLLAPAASPVAVRGWEDYPAVLARIQAPVFPDRDFAITAFGAAAGGADCTEAIARAIAACHAAGGGRVVVPAGEWHTGPVHLKSNVNLHVAEGATLKFSTDPKKYLPVVLTRWEGVECYNYSPLIYALDQENIAVTGKGTIDGQADWDNWWAWVDTRRGNNTLQAVLLQNAGRNRLFAMGEKGVPVEQRIMGEGSMLRPSFFQPYRCKNVLFEGLTVKGSPMWILNPVLCTNVIIRGATIISHGNNNDGCNPDSSRDVLIEDCLFDTGDDCIAIKSGRNNDGRRVGVASENIIVRNCIMKDGHGGVVLGSECSGDIRNVFVENCTMDSPDLERVLRFKSNVIRGGILENVFMRNVKIGRVEEALLHIDLAYPERGASPTIAAFHPVVRNVQVDNISSTASPRTIYIRGYAGATVDGIRIANSTFKNVTLPDLIEHAGTITFDNVTVEPAKKVKSLNTVPASK